MNTFLFYLLLGYIIPTVIVWIYCIIVYKYNTEDATIGGLFEQQGFGFVVSFIPLMNIIAILSLILEIIVYMLKPVWNKIKDIKI